MQWEEKATKLVQGTWAQILAVPLPRFVTIGKLINLPCYHQRQKQEIIL